MSLCDGGLGIYTRCNTRHLALVTDAGQPRVHPPARIATVAARRVDGSSWRAYHKTGGARRWWAAAEHAIRWGRADRAEYDIRATARAGEPLPGVVLCGIATQLSARLVAPGAMWESNKAFEIFPQDPDALPAEVVMVLVNSALLRGDGRRPEPRDLAPVTRPRSTTDAAPTGLGTGRAHHPVPKGGQGPS